MYNIFSLPDFKFPEGFLWGSATAAQQIEGNNIYNHHYIAEQNGEFEDKCGMACNSYELYEEDIKLLKKLGHQVYRLSVEWSRMEPEEGKWCEEAILHYVNELKLLQANGIKVCLTLFHFTEPEWFYQKGAFHKRENIKYFERYVEKVVPYFAPYVAMWNVLNEINGTDYAVNAVIAHGKAYHIIKKYSDRPVSTAHSFVMQYPQRPYDKLDNIMAQYRDLRINEFFFHAIRTGEIIYPGRDAEYIPEVKDSVDFWAINIYTRNMVDSRKADLHGKRYPSKKLDMINKQFYLDEMYPEGVTACLERLKDKPVYITENGCSSYDDDYRIVYIALYLSAIKDAIDNGVDVSGYMYWSLMDNWEWGSYKPQFGLAAVDRKSFERTVRPSGYFYKDIIDANGFSQEILRKYLTKLPYSVINAELEMRN